MEVELLPDVRRNHLGDLVRVAEAMFQPWLSSRAEFRNYECRGLIKLPGHGQFALLSHLKK